MREYDISTDVPAIVSLRLKIKAKTKVEAVKQARLYIKRAFDENHEEEGWDGVICYEEQPKLEVESVDTKGMKIEATNWDNAPVFCSHPLTGEWCKLKNHAEYENLRRIADEKRNSKSVG